MQPKSKQNQVQIGTKIDPNRPPNGSKSTPGDSKAPRRVPGASRELPGAAQEGPGVARRRPRECPRSPQERPRVTPDHPRALKRNQNGDPRTLPRPILKAPRLKTKVGTNFQTFGIDFTTKNDLRFDTNVWLKVSSKLPAANIPT